MSGFCEWQRRLSATLAGVVWASFLEAVTGGWVLKVKAFCILASGVWVCTVCGHRMFAAVPGTLCGCYHSPYCYYLLIRMVMQWVLRVLSYCRGLCEKRERQERDREALMYRRFFWTLWEREKVGRFGRMALKHVKYHVQML